MKLEDIKLGENYCQTDYGYVIKAIAIEGNNVLAEVVDSFDSQAFGYKVSSHSNLRNLYNKNKLSYSKETRACLMWIEELCGTTLSLEFIIDELQKEISK